jgi:glycosyltransferase involved in cell wall biosynthesis
VSPPSGAEGEPCVTVIIPVKNRRVMLAAALDGLEAQTFRDFEVVVVDDGSTDGSGEEAAARLVAGREVRVVRGDGCGAVAARQLGTAAARGEILAFTDSDCVPQPAWLETGVAAIRRGADVTNGLTMPARPMRPLERSMGSGLEGLYPTCNIFYRRAAFDAAGGFDGGAADRLGFRPDRRSRGDGFGEDTLLAWRVARRGTVAYAPEAVVEHAVFPPDHREAFSRALRVGAFPALVKEVPELRSTLLHRRWQLGPRTRLPVYGMALALLVGRPKFAAACLTWWVAIRMQELRRYPVPWARRLAVLPVEMGLDVLTAGALAAGSISARTVVL